jgi:hypothetical protein
VRDHAVPAAAFILPEQARGRIPGAVLAIQQPAPVGNERQQHPDRLAERAGKMGDTGVHRDDEIEIADQGCGIGEIL